MEMAPFHTQTYSTRAKSFNNAAARQLLETMERKKTNLCVSVDVTKKDDVLRIVEVVGPYVCMIKTHADIIEDFDVSFVQQLLRLSETHNFMIFEDRKFADIGNTVKLQYSQGVHKIASWSHFTNAHVVPGPSIITGLASIGLPLGRGLFLLAEMSSQGSLATGEYTKEAIRMARQHKNFVVGFIAQRRMEGLVPLSPSDLEEDFLILTPGVSLATSGDGMGQQYRTPREVILESGSDIIIVGRAIYGIHELNEIRSNAERYQVDGWQAYLARSRV